MQDCCEKRCHAVTVKVVFLFLLHPRRDKNKLVFHQHKFYLAFENAICKDYVTEKIFTRMGMILPVVMGG